jgi:hypothetical protein
MFSKKWLGLAALFLGISLLLAACGEETSDDPPGTLPATRLSLDACSKAATSITPKAGQVVPTPGNTAGVRVELPAGTKLYISNTFPYAVALPAEWDVKDGQVQQNIKGDLFIIKKSNNSGAYVTIIAEKLNGQEDGKTFFENKVKEATATQKIEFDRQSERQIAGTTAYGLSYNLQAGQPFSYPVQFMQEVFVAQGWGWGISFTASPNYAAQYCPYFARMLDSFTLTGLVK